jgi:hypothetical protein
VLGVMLLGHCEGIRRVAIVVDEAGWLDILNLVSKAAESTVIYAWSLMTNHAYLLLRSGSGGLTSFIRNVLNGYSVFNSSIHSVIRYRLCPDGQDWKSAGQKGSLQADLSISLAGTARQLGVPALSAAW